MRLAIVVPCRGEAAVIERKIANLARARLPRTAMPHRVIVVDDGSADDTSERAHAALAQHLAARADVEAVVTPNDVRPGKPGAIRTGIARAAGCDLIVLTDADVIVEEGAFEALARAFERDARLALACGAQRFVRDLADDGALRGRDSLPLVDASGVFDRWTARVRAFETRRGSVFSVHGQLLAWRANLGLAPSFGVAADDIDLRFQVKARPSEPRRIELVQGALFVEVKTPAGASRRAQAARRARAWFQALERGPIPARGMFERVQALFYRHAPRIAPAASFAIAPICAAAAAFAGVPLIALAMIVVFAVLLASPWGRRWIDLSRTIWAAARAERAAPLGDRWETSRT